MNDDTDEFLERIGVNVAETNAEMKGRHYVEEQSRFATVTAVAELARAVASVSRTQAKTSDTIVTLSGQILDIKKGVDRMTLWMEGDVDDHGTRLLGFVDYIGTFRRWKGTVTALLTVAATAMIGLLAVSLFRLVVDFTALGGIIHK